MAGPSTALLLPAIVSFDCALRQVQDIVNTITGSQQAWWKALLFEYLVMDPVHSTSFQRRCCRVWVPRRRSLHPRLSGTSWTGCRCLCLGSVGDVHPCRHGGTSVVFYAYCSCDIGSKIMAQQVPKVAATSLQLENVLQPDVQNRTREELSARSDLVFQATATWTDRYGPR